MHLAGCKTTITAGERPQTHALGSTALGIGSVCVCMKVKQSRYRHGVAQRVPEVKVPRFHDNSVVRLSALRTGRFYTQEMLLVLVSVRG